MSWRELYKISEASKQLISSKFVPYESKGVTYKAYSSAVMSLLTMQKVRVPMLIQPESVGSALEVM